MKRLYIQMDGGGEREAAGQPSETEEHSRCRCKEYIKKKRKRSSALCDAGSNIGFCDISERMCLRLLQRQIGPK